MRREVRWERMFPDELNAALAQCPLVYLTYGLCEPHGPQNAVGQDALRAHGAACLAARKHGGIVAPPHYWHIHELGGYGAWGHARIGQARTWLTALPPWMFFKQVCYHIRAVDALGFHAALLFTGHAGPHSQDLPTVMEILQPHFATRLAFCADYELTPTEYLADFGHGGSIETAYLWALEPDCVDVSRLPSPDDPGPHFAMGENAAEADRRTGERVVAGIADRLWERARDLLAEYDRISPQRSPRTFGEVERIWECELAPRLPDFACMAQAPEGSCPEPPADSQWRSNWVIPTRF